jgi:hypothetical protein
MESQKYSQTQYKIAYLISFISLLFSFPFYNNADHIFPCKKAEQLFIYCRITEKPEFILTLIFMVYILSRNRSRNRNRNLSKVGTATGTVKKVTVLQHCLKAYTHNIDNLNNLDIDKLDILDNHDNIDNLDNLENLNNLENYSVSVHMQYFIHYTERKGAGKSPHIGRVPQY